jgi:PilZ domain-containing protein
MRRLTPNQPVTIELDAEFEGEVETLLCRVGSVHGPVATLAPASEIAERMRERLTPGSLGFMVFRHNSTPVGLRGVVRAAPTDEEIVEFVVIDGIQVTERRTAERVAMITPVRAIAEGGDEVVHTVTANLSLGGALLTRRPGLGEGPTWRLGVSIPGDPSPIRCEATIARMTPTHIGVRFDGMSEADSIRLAGALADHQRRRAALQAGGAGPVL